MAIKTHGAGDRLGTNAEGPRNFDFEWIALAALVYAWTDRRKDHLDRDWWKNAGARFYRPALQQQAGAQ